jgi:hypothetical protein
MLCFGTSPSGARLFSVSPALRLGPPTQLVRAVMSAQRTEQVNQLIPARFPLDPTCTATIFLSRPGGFGLRTILEFRLHRRRVFLADLGSSAPPTPRCDLNNTVQMPVSLMIKRLQCYLTPQNPQAYPELGMLGRQNP